MSEAAAPATRRSTAAWTRIRSASPAYWILAGLVLAGVILRVVAIASWWPASTTLSDPVAYAVYAESDPLGDPAHPAGYPAMLALIGFVTREIAVTILLQHLLAIGAALLLFAATRRLTGSPWPGLAPAAVVLLSPDLIFLEHTIMSEGPFMAVFAAAAYATVRAIDAPDPWWRWPVAAGLLVVLATVFRSAALFFVPVALLAILLSHPRPWRPRWRGPVAALGVAVVLLGAYASTNLAANGRLEIGPTQGWHMYGRVASFADCGQFTPPAGTRQLCENSDPATRHGGDFYLYYPDSPAQRAFGPEPWRDHDAELGAWARQVIVHQPKTYAKEVWRDLRAYFVPSARSPRFYAGGELDPELDWTAAIGPEATAHLNATRQGLGTFFDPFQVTRDVDGIEFLHDYQRVVRFGATLLAIASLLTLLGLLLGPRRSRVGVLLFGVGGLATLLGPTLSVWPTGRYMVTVAPMIAAGAAITVWTLWRMWTQRGATNPTAQP